MKTLFKNAYIYDGSGKAPFMGEILIEDSKITAIGDNIKQKPDKEIDCKGYAVAPGFIDAHSHNDFFYNYDDSEKFYKPFIEQGITTQITGNCGFSPFGIDAKSPYKDKVGGGLFHAKNPSSFIQFCKETKDNLYVNMIPLIGHGTTRISISGYDSKPLSKEQIEEQMLLVDEAMQNGAFGGSFGFMYEPGIYSKKDELIAFAKKIAEYDGILTVHPRACSKVALGYPLFSKPHIELALEEVVDIMKESGVRTEYSHLIFVGKTSWKSIEPMLKIFHDLRDKGYKIGYDNYSFTYGASVITVILPPWYMSLSKEDRKKPINVLRLRLMTYITKKILGIDFCDFTVAYIGEGYKHYEGRTVDEIARQENMSSMNMYLKLVDLSDGQGRLYVDKYYNEDLIKRLMEDDISIFMTDAWVEEAGTQNAATYQGFTNFLAKAEKYSIPLEKIINKMTGATAERFQIPARGLLKEGYYADITVFAPNEIKVNPKQPDLKSEGIKYVFVNGKAVIENGKYNRLKAGELILRK